MQLAEFIDRLIPGDTGLGVPCFTAVAWQGLQAEYTGLCEQVCTVLKAIKNGPDGSGMAVDSDEELMQLISLFNKIDTDLFNRFRETVLGLYFSSPQVLAAMGEATEPLFPRGQSISDNDFDRLEAVYNRGKIWRSATGE